MRRSIDWRAAAWAGLAAGVIATAAQIILWGLSGYAVPGLLARDARLTAAIVLGRAVLQSSPGSIYEVLLAAALVHFLLSLVYGLILVRLVSRRGVMWSLGAGIVYGLLLFGVNMYGFTRVFPWFEQARDWITLLAHAVFGASCAGIYNMLRRY